LSESAGEAAIVKAWQAVAKAQSQRFVKPEHRPRIELAQRRLPLVEALHSISRDLPPDQLDRRLLSVWNGDLAQGCAEAEAWRPAYEWAVYRKQLLDRIEQAINARDDATAIELLEDPSLENYSLPASWTSAVQAARDRLAKTEALLAALDTGDLSSFCELFDARIIRKYADRFSRHESLLSEWTRSKILPLEGLGLGPAVGRASLYCMDEAEGTYRVRWTWPQQRFADDCILAVCQHEPDAHADPRELEMQYRLPLDRRNWESGGGSRVIHVKPEWTGSWVIVWAIVDLAFQTFASHPLALGRLEPGEKGPGQARKAWNVLSPLRGKKSPEPIHSEEVVEPSESEDGPQVT